MVLIVQRVMVLMMQGDLDMLIELISLIHSIKYSLRYTVLVYIPYLLAECYSHLLVTETTTLFSFLQIFEDEANHFASDIQVNFFHYL